MKRAWWKVCKEEKRGGEERRGEERRGEGGREGGREGGQCDYGSSQKMRELNGR